MAKNNNPRLKLLLGGGNPRYEEYHQQLYEKWKPWIILTPPQPFFETIGIVALSDIILVHATNSLANNCKFPYELVEAMALAKPIISTQVGDIPEIVGDTAYLVPPNDPDAIVEKINYILDNPQEAEAKAQQARQRCQDHYSLEQLTNTLEQVITLATYSMG